MPMVHNLAWQVTDQTWIWIRPIIFFTLDHKQISPKPHFVQLYENQGLRFFKSFSSIFLFTRQNKSSTGILDISNNKIHEHNNNLGQTRFRSELMAQCNTTWFHTSPAHIFICIHLLMMLVRDIWWIKYVWHMLFSGGWSNRQTHMQIITDVGTSMHMHPDHQHILEMW
jgi:hypothetical protein